MSEQDQGVCRLPGGVWVLIWLAVAVLAVSLIVPFTLLDALGQAAKR